MVSQINEKGDRLQPDLASFPASFHSFHSSQYEPQLNGLPPDTFTAGRIGQVERIIFPNTWAEQQPPEPRFGVMDSTREFALKAEETAKIVFWYRGPNAADDSAKAFHALLSNQAKDVAPHELSEAERESIAATLGNFGRRKSFDMRWLRTINLNSKSLLFVEGIFKLSGLGVMCIFIDALPAKPGQLVQRIYFQAPQDPEAPNARGPNNLYDLHLNSALKIFRSIEWVKPNGDSV